MIHKIINRHNRLFFFFLTLSFWLVGCNKDNVDYSYDYRPNPDAQAASNIRLINLSENAQLIANGDTLTNFFVPPRRSGYIPPEESTYPGTRYFPANGRLGESWAVPQDLFLPDGGLNFKTTYVTHITQPIASHDVEFTVRENYNEPKDYYLLLNHEGRVQEPEKVVEVPRSVTVPTRADHFKIRILNFSKKLLSSSAMEDLAGPITLVYADGTPVSTATTNISGDRWSEYVEVPYGTYQFRILTADGRQIPATGQPLYYNTIDRHTSTIDIGSGDFAGTSSGLTFAPIETFQPGGIYSIVVHPTSFTWSTGSDDITELQNGFRILADISEPLNRTYSQVQLANTIQGQDVVLRVKGQTTAATAYGTASGYQRVIAGKQTITVQSTSGQPLLTQEVELLGGQNYTVWVYADADKKPQIVFAANNLAGTTYTGQGSDGNNATINRSDSQFFFHYRFLNFCAQVPFATFTDGDGRPYAGSSTAGQGVNVALGALNVLHPYAAVPYGMSGAAGEAYQFMAYSSLPNRIPGDWLKQIVPLSSAALVANPALYTTVGRKVPAHEPGVYSIVLIGELDSPDPAGKARFMVVKHTK